jgi:hypothetical protein
MDWRRKTYVGTSKRDANFPGRLDLECPSCMMQAETIIDFFGQPGKQFLLFYHPARPTAFTTPPPFLRALLARREKGGDQPEVRASAERRDVCVVCRVSCAAFWADRTGLAVVQGRYPLYSLDAGMIAPTAYERLAWGSALVGVGGLGLHPRYRFGFFRRMSCVSCRSPDGSSLSSSLSSTGRNRGHSV